MPPSEVSNGALGREIHYKMGNKDATKQALGRALGLNPQFSGADEARRVLGELQ